MKISYKKLIEDLQQGRYLVNFPYACYRLPAVLRTALGARLTFILGATGLHYDSLDLTFSPDPSDPDGHPYNPVLLCGRNNIKSSSFFTPFILSSPDFYPGFSITQAKKFLRKILIKIE
jgi:hypothetical protein